MEGALVVIAHPRHSTRLIALLGAMAMTIVLALSHKVTWFLDDQKLGLPLKFNP